MWEPQTLDSTRNYLLTLSHPNKLQNLIGVFTGDEAMEGTIWSGENQAAIASFAAGWDGSVVGNPNAIANPVVSMTVTAGAIASLSPGIYEFRVFIPATATQIYRGQIEFEAGPGTGTAPKFYGTRKDMIDLVPWLEMIQGAGDISGFADQRQLARDWVDQRVLNAVPFDSGWVRDQLAADKLLLTGPEGRRLVRAVSLYAAGLVLEREPGKQGEKTYRDLGQEMKEDADSLLTAGVVWIDTDGDGVGDYGIYPGLRHFLRA
jgi:hypothetical protein